MIILFFLPIAVLCGPVVVTKYGEIEGLEVKANDGSAAHVFLGIRYANAPDHIHRFNRPHMVDSWAPIRHHATKFRASCIPFHNAFIEDDKYYNEDCLFLNIFAPAKREGKLPVLVFVHGGGYEIGDATEMGYQRAVDNFVTRGIIVVTLQYRLGPLGFFTTGDQIAPGNMGLWDQATALEFLHEVLPDFKGDPEKMTVSGNSAGSASVSALTFSPHADVYFHQTIEMSGSMFAEFALSDSVVDESLELARVLGCKNDDSMKVLECMREKTMQEILDGVDKIGSTRPHPNILKFHPRIDGEFFPHSLEDMLKKAVPKRVLSGVTDQESALFVMGPKLVDVFAGTQLPREKWDNYTRQDLFNFFANSVATEHEYGRRAGPFLELLEKFYIERDAPENPSSQFYVQRYVDLLCDLQFNVPALHELELRRLNGWLSYFYVLHHVSAAEKRLPRQIKGAWHATELKYLFDYMGISDDVFDESDKKFRAHFVEAISNFVTSGDPSTEEFKWPAVSDKEPWVHAALGVPPTVEKVFRPETLEFWLHTVPTKIGAHNLHRTRLPGAQAHRAHTEL